MSLPFKSLLPYDGRVVILAYQPFLPFCLEAAGTSQTSDSDSETSES